MKIATQKFPCFLFLTPIIFFSIDASWYHSSLSSEKWESCQGVMFAIMLDDNYFLIFLPRPQTNMLHANHHSNLGVAACIILRLNKDDFNEFFFQVFMRVLILCKKLNVTFLFLSLFVELYTFLLGHVGTLNLIFFEYLP